MTRTWQQQQQLCARLPLCKGFCNQSTRVNLTNGLPHNVFASLARQHFQYAPVLSFKLRGGQGPCRLTGGFGRGLVAAYLPPSAIWDCRHVFDFFRNVPSWRNQAHWSEILLCHTFYDSSSLYIWSDLFMLGSHNQASMMLWLDAKSSVGLYVSSCFLHILVCVCVSKTRWHKKSSAMYKLLSAQGNAFSTYHKESVK